MAGADMEAGPQTSQFRCSYCGAPLDVTPDSVVVVCSYCGKANFVADDIPKEDLGDPVAVPAIKSDEAAKAAVEAARRSLELRLRFKRLTFGDPDLYYIPYYFVSARLRASYRARVEVTYTRTTYVGGRAQTEVVSRTVNVSGRVEHGGTIPVLARRNVGGVAAERLARHYMETAPKAAPLEGIPLDQRTSKAFLAAEFGKSRAIAVALREAVDELLKEVDRDAKRRAADAVGHPAASATILDRTVDYEVERVDSTPVTYLPVWVAPYIYEGSLYSFALAGWDGALLAAARPVFMEQRIGYAAAAVLAAGLMGGLGGAMFLSNWAVGAGLVGLGGALGYLAARNIAKVRSVR
ncbi:MAG: hypothetical protein RRB51_11245 [Thermoproteus sp.]|nr:hypothetical protein [Thermoproteus sp.]